MAHLVQLDCIKGRCKGAVFVNTAPLPTLKITARERRAATGEISSFLTFFRRFSPEPNLLKMGLLHRIGLLLLLTVVFLALAQTEAAPVSSQGAVADDADDADTEGLEFDVDANVANILKTFGINNLDDLNIDDDKPGKGQLVDIKRLFGRNNGPGTTTSSSSRIKNVIVFVLENRSFDRTLGHLKIPGQKIDNLVGKQFYNLVNVSNPKSRKVYSSTNSTYWELCPSHTFPSVYEQVYGVPFPGQGENRFVQ